MTRIVFDLESVARTGEQGGAVTFRAPEFRKGEDGTIITTYKERINLADTPGFVDVHPGPIEVELIAPNDGDSLRVEFNVPDTDEISLSEFLHGGELLDPTTVNDVRSLLFEFRDSGEAAIASAAAALTSETNAKTSETNAASSASSALTSKNSASSSASSATTSKNAAAASAAAALTSETNAKTSETNAAASAATSKAEADRAAGIAGSTRWVGTKLEVNGQMSPDLKGELPVVYSTTPPKDKNVIWVNPDEDLPEPTGGTSGPVSWESVTGKPTTFTPTSHSHTIADTTGLQSALDGKASTSHTHTASQISDATATGKSLLTASSPTAARSAIAAGTSNLAIGTTATTAAAGNHTHTPASIGAAPATHTHAIGDVTGLQSALDGKVNTSQIQIVQTLPASPVAGTVYITTG